VNIKKVKNSLKGVPSIIFGNQKDSKNSKSVDLDLFSNFFNIAIGDAFLRNPNCNMLILDDKTMNEYFNQIRSLRCIKVYSGRQKKLDLNFHYTMLTKSTIDCGLKVATTLGCNPLLVCGLEIKKYNDVRDSLFSIDRHGEARHIDPFVAYSTYNDICPDKLDLMKKFI